MHVTVRLQSRSNRCANLQLNQVAQLVQGGWPHITTAPSRQFRLILANNSFIFLTCQEEERYILYLKNMPSTVNADTLKQNLTFRPYNVVNERL